MEVYKIDTKGYITDIKQLKKGYILKENEIEGIPEYNLGRHYQTGLEKPKTQAQLDAERVTELKKIIDDKRYIGDDVTAEQNELRTLLGY